MMMFRVGEKVVYPNHGVATVENISSRSFGSQFERFYLLRLMYSTMTVMVPFSHVGNVGLRPITKLQEVDRVLEYLACGDCSCNSDWKNRFKENSAKMRTGSLGDISEVFKSLVRLQTDKPLSFREKKMLEKARQMLVAEVSVAKNLDEAKAVDLLDRSLAASDLRMPSAY
jgi:CarD family transcriptional regulator